MRPTLPLCFGLALALPPPPTPITCQTQSQPNPIAVQYPNLVTLTINGTVAVLPIPYALARSIIPSQYAILPSYKALLPYFPADKYPLIIESVLDHDIRYTNISIPDFTRIAFTFPFVDLLHDGYSTFRYENYLAISQNPIAISGSAAYGETPIPGTFDPPCDGYAYAPGKAGGEIHLDYYEGLDQSLGKPPAITTAFRPVRWEGPYSLEFYKNVTNQPQFGNGLMCDNFITLYNSSVTERKYAPVTVRGKVRVGAPFLPGGRLFEGVWGLKVDRAVIENNMVQCASLKGYKGTGPGDSME